MNRLFLLIVVLTMSNLAIAASTTLTWIGKVPSNNCLDNKISNQTKWITLQNRCNNDITLIKHNKELKKAIVSFNL